MELTILTPTYNRGEVLGSPFESLQNQSNKDFMWMIVDDGSTDGTKQYVEKMQLEANFLIKYIHKENGGKHTALNVGIKVINSELIFIVDSDDTVVPDAVETILRYHEKYKGKENLCGYVFLRRFPDGQINGQEFNPDEMIATYIDARINADDTQADKAEVFLTQCLREFPFPVYNGEKFLGEDIVWIRMSKKYSMVHINKAIYVGNYLEDGLTKNRRLHNIKSPIGCMHRAMEFICPEIKLRYRIKGALQYIVYGKFAGYKLGKLICEAPDKLLITAVSLPGIVLYRKWRRSYS